MAKRTRPTKALEGDEEEDFGLRFFSTTAAAYFTVSAGCGDTYDPVVCHAPSDLHNYAEYCLLTACRTAGEGRRSGRTLSPVKGPRRPVRFTGYARICISGHIVCPPPARTKEAAEGGREEQRRVTYVAIKVMSPSAVRSTSGRFVFLFDRLREPTSIYLKTRCATASHPHLPSTQLPILIEIIAEAVFRITAEPVERIARVNQFRERTIE